MRSPLAACARGQGDGGARSLGWRAPDSPAARVICSAPHHTAPSSLPPSSLSTPPPRAHRSGNHEIESFFGLNFVPYRARFRFPCAEQCTSPTFPLYYAVNVGPVRLIVMNSFGNYSEGSDQLAWARKQFQSVDLSLTPWVVLMEHTPMYSSNIDHYDSGKPLLALIEDDIKPLGKRMVVLAGHVHAYERSHPVYNNTVDETGPVYVTIGDGGNREGLYDAWTQPQPAWSAVRKAEYGHGVLRANSTALAWEWHTITTDEPVVSDSFVRTL